MVFSSTPTPVGKLFIAACNRGLCLSAFSESSMMEKTNSHCALGQFSANDPPKSKFGEKSGVADRVIAQALASINDYFSGKLDSLVKVPIYPEGTEFQQKIWRVIKEIEPGTTLSYSQLAAAAKNPKAVRAAALACKANPLMLFIPCHRVIRKDGSISGFAAGEEIKTFLLEHEKSIFAKR